MTELNICDIIEENKVSIDQMTKRMNEYDAKIKAFGTFECPEKHDLIKLRAYLQQAIYNVQAANRKWEEYNK